MFHVDNSSAVPVMPAVKPVVSAATSYFTEGGNGVPPTYPGPDWFNIVQSELLAILAAAGINPDKANNAQLLAAMKLLFLNASQNGADIQDKAAFLQNLGLGEGTKTANGRLWLPGGWLLQWGISTTNASDGSTGTIANFPIAFPNGCFRMCGADVGNGANPFGFNPISATQFRHWGKDSAGSYTNTTTQYFAIGY